MAVQQIITSGLNSQSYTGRLVVPSLFVYPHKFIFIFYFFLFCFIYGLSLFYAKLLKFDFLKKDKTTLFELHFSYGN